MITPELAHQMAGGQPAEAAGTLVDTEAIAELGLTEREQEVLFLLAQHKTAGDIERELCVAHGTAKAHIRHVYKKLDIHAREELFDLVEQGDEGR